MNYYCLCQWVCSVDILDTLLVNTYNMCTTLYLWFTAMKATNLTVDNVTNHSAIFSWDIPPPNIGCNGNPIDTAFRVRYKSENGTLQRINVRERSLVLPDLLPFTNYTVYVVTPNPSGSNARSSDFVFTSLPGSMHQTINLGFV